MTRTRLRGQGILRRHLREDVESLERQVRLAQRAAADTATEASRSRFKSKLVGRPSVPPRPGRRTTQGTFPSHIKWVPDGELVRLSTEELDAVAAEFWLIQEIGTGKTAQMSRTGDRPSTSVSVRPQGGRRIPSGLVWSGVARPAQGLDGKRAEGPGGHDQIVPGPWGQPITIRREIRGKNYIRTGGNRGFRTYDIALEKAFKKAFGHHPKTR